MLQIQQVPIMYMRGGIVLVKYVVIKHRIYDIVSEGLVLGAPSTLVHTAHDRRNPHTLFEHHQNVNPK